MPESDDESKGVQRALEAPEVTEEAAGAGEEQQTTSRTDRGDGPRRGTVNKREHVTSVEPSAPGTVEEVSQLENVAAQVWCVVTATQQGVSVGRAVESRPCFSGSGNGPRS